MRFDRDHIRINRTVHRLLFKQLAENVYVRVRTLSSNNRLADNHTYAYKEHGYKLILCIVSLIRLPRTQAIKQT